MTPTETSNCNGSAMTSFAASGGSGARSNYKTVLADPPWKMDLQGGNYSKTRNKRPKRLPYQTMSIAEVCALPVGQMADDGCHLWLWTANQYLRQGFDVMDAWGFKYLAPITWVKPSGLGHWFIHRTQTILFGYKGRCEFPLERYLPNVFEAPAGRHSAKPEKSYDLIERVSPGPRLELFARERRLGWSAWGNEVASDVTLVTPNEKAHL